MMLALCACLVYLFFHDKAAQLTVMQQGQNRIWEERHSVAGPLCSFPPPPMEGGGQPKLRLSNQGLGTLAFGDQS